VNISFLTLGCKVNQAESSQIAAELLAHGCKVVDLNGHPDLCIINTCSVTSKSDYQSRQLIRRAAKTGSKVIVTGCYSELNEEAVGSMDGVAVVVPNNKKEFIASMLCNLTSCEDLKIGQNARSRLFVKVQDGCNNACSYCVIPRARGGSRSKEINEVIEEINSAAEFYNEAVISGIHLGTYGYDMVPKVSLYTLLRTILLKTNVKRIRLSSLEINEIDDELIELIQEKRVCKHLHIPLQSGDNKILEMMNRNYNILQFKDKLSLILRKLPGISIGTDIIVGFPGEGDTEFENTKKLIEDTPISYIHVFPFSPRKGTRAFEMKPRVNDFIKKERCKTLRSLGKRKKSEYMLKQAEEMLDLLIEEVEEDGACVGTTGNYLRARAYLDTPRLKDVVYLRIAEVRDETLIGHPIELS
jgi:threonylcarbamoyladenosine tRNA methylthiotransferase MtaB